MINRIAGIDPGLDGGLVLLEKATGWHPSMIAVMPTTGDGKRELDLGGIRTWLERSKPCLVALERQQAMPKQGVSSTFRTGYGYGLLLGLCHGLGLRVGIYRALTWQTAIFAGAPDVGGTKAVAAYVAAKLWPAVDWRATLRCRVPHDGLVDAALIAEYARRAACSE